MPVTPFGGLDESALRGLAPGGAVRAYPKNAVVVSEGDVTDALYVILSGRVKVFVTDEQGKEVVISTISAGDYFGELVLDGGPRSASIMALEPCRFFVIPQPDVERMLSTNPAFAQGVDRAGLHAKAAENALGHVDVELRRVADQRAGDLRADHLDAAGGAGRLAQIAADAPLDPVGVAEQAERAPVGVGQLPLFPRILEGDRLDEHVLERDAHRLDNLGEGAVANPVNDPLHGLTPAVKRPVGSPRWLGAWGHRRTLLRRLPHGPPQMMTPARASRG